MAEAKTANKTEAAADETKANPPKADPPKDEGNQTEEVSERFHVRNGISYKIVRTTFDHRQNCVIDHVLVPRTVQDRRDKDHNVELIMRVYSQDVELQKKWQTETPNITEITDV